MGKKINDLKQMYKSEINYTKKKKSRRTQILSRNHMTEAIRKKYIKYMLKGKGTRNYTYTCITLR